MSVLVEQIRRRRMEVMRFASGLIVVFTILMSWNAQALPLFARQTGQNCVSCHAGGQFPELTAYGRKFKLTGYTMGNRTEVPLAVMGTVSMVSVRNKTPGSGDVEGDFPQN